MIIKNLRTELKNDFKLHQIHLDLSEGQILTLIGRSGSGKSTLLRCLAGLEPYQVEFEEKPTEVGFVFQSVNLFPHLNLTENIALALKKVQRKTEAEIKDKVNEVLTLVRMTHRSNHYPHQLSGGENQRGAIARALALNPKVIFYDEPTSALDPELVDEVMDLILSLKQKNIMQILVTHELKAVKKISDQIGFMSSGELKMICSFSELENKSQNLSEEDKKYVQLFY